MQLLYKFYESDTIIIVVVKCRMVPNADVFDGNRANTGTPETSMANVENGNFSNVKPVGQGVSEHKLDFGLGYSIYFGKNGEQACHFAWWGHEEGLYFSKGHKEKEFELGLRTLIFISWKILRANSFVGTNLGEEAPEHSYFANFRKHLGTEGLMDIFSQVRNSL